MLKHVVKDEKWACSTLKAGKNKLIVYITKTRDFERFYEKKEGATVSSDVLIKICTALECKLDDIIEII